MGDETFVFSGNALAAWKPAHGSLAHIDPAGLLIADSADLTWHLLHFESPAFAYRQISIKVTASPCHECNTCLYFNHMGGVDLLSVTRDGEVLVRGPISSAGAGLDGGGRIVVNASYASSSSHVFLGTSSATGDAHYSGLGTPQWIISEIEITTTDLATVEAGLIVLVDVGASGGIDGAWGPLLPHMRCVLVEPDPIEAEALRAAVAAFPNALVLEAALSDADGERHLNVTRYGLCSSLLEPDGDALARYAVAPCFDVIKRVPVSVRRYDGIPGAPSPDVIKIDVQGAEYEVLIGFGEHLNTVLAVELESHFYAIYKGQKLIGDLVAMLGVHGLRLRRIEPQYNFDRDFVEVNAFFTREGPLSPDRACKLDRIHKQLSLPKHMEGGNFVARVLGWSYDRTVAASAQASEEPA